MSRVRRAFEASNKARRGAWIGLIPLAVLVLVGFVSAGVFGAALAAIFVLVIWGALWLAATVVEWRWAHNAREPATPIASASVRLFELRRVEPGAVGDRIHDYAVVGYVRVHADELEWVPARNRGNRGLTPLRFPYSALDRVEVAQLPGRKKGDAWAIVPQEGSDVVMYVDAPREVEAAVAARGVRVERHDND
jgi:hypothetical protein